MTKGKGRPKGAKDKAPRANREQPVKGRPSVLTADVMKTVIEYARKGNYLDVCARAAGVGRTTLLDAVRIGREQPGSTRLGKFAREVDRAVAQSEIDGVERITAAGKRQWQAEAWRLERRFAKRWAQRPRGDETKLEKLVGELARTVMRQAQIVFARYLSPEMARTALIELSRLSDEKIEGLPQFARVEDDDGKGESSDG